MFTTLRIVSLGAAVMLAAIASRQSDPAGFARALERVLALRAQAARSRAQRVAQALQQGVGDAHLLRH